jgi:elongation factor G
LKVYESSRIRNIAVIGHGSAGKTSLAEAMLFNAGHINRLGKVDDGTATTDYFPEEIKRKISVSTSLAPCEWKDCKINIMDTPGYADFFSEVKGALRVADSVLLVLCAVSGVEVQTEIGWRETEKANLPKVALINKMDRENANFDRVLQQMKDVFKKNIVPIQLPIGSVENFSGIVDILKMKAYKYASSSGEYQEEEIPDEMKAAAESAREELIEAAAEGDDELLMKYLDGEELSEEEIDTGLKNAFKANSFVPVLCASTLNNIGIGPILDFIADIVPSPIDVTEKPMEEEPQSALVFKTLADPYVGKLNFFRVYGGSLKSDSVIYNANKEKEEKIGQVFTMRGKNQETLCSCLRGNAGRYNMMAHPRAVFCSKVVKFPFRNDLDQRQDTRLFCA